MNKMLIFALLASVIILISGCESITDVRSVKELIGPINIDSDDCRKVISEEVEILQIKVPSKTTITLASLKKFDDIEDAKEYVNNWKYIDGAKADLAKDIRGGIEVGVIKVDKVSEAYTHAVVCVDGEIMENSEKTLKKIA